MSTQKPVLLEFLEAKGITLKDLIDTTLEFFVPHPGVETKEVATKMLQEEFYDALSDVNVSTLEVASFRAQDDADAGLIPGLSRERYLGRPGLVSDELLGLAIAGYARAISNRSSIFKSDSAYGTVQLC